MIIKDQRTKIILAVVLISIGVVGRLVRIYYLPELYNVEPFTAMSLLAGSVLGGGYALTVPLSMVAISDMVIGNTSIMFFTWSAWAIIGLLGTVLRKRKAPTASFALRFTGAGVVSSLFFFLWTNFGVWLVDGIYPHTLHGLMQSYVMGLPFLRNNIFGNLVVVPIVSLGAIMVWKIIELRMNRSKQIVKEVGV